MPLVSLTPANLLPVPLTPAANLPPISTTLAVLVANLPPMVHLDLQISLHADGMLSLVLQVVGFNNISLGIVEVDTFISNSG